MKVSYTKHALKKFVDLRLLGVRVSKKNILRVLQKPMHVLTDEPPKKIAVGKLDDRHDVCVVYKHEHDIITVITFFPTSSERYRI